MHTSRGTAALLAAFTAVVSANLLAACPVHAQTAKTPAAEDTSDNLERQKRDTLACTGPFAKDSTHANLVAAFGAKNVTFKEVDGAKGSKARATVLFDDDPTRRIVVFWHDERSRTKPSVVNVSAPSLWVGPGGVGNGMTLGQVEKLNGKPFKLAGFDWDGGGLMRELDGRLKPAGCNLIIRFEPGIASPLPAKYAEIVGDKLIVSTNKLLRRTRAQVSEWGIGYPQ